LNHVNGTIFSIQNSYILIKQLTRKTIQIWNV